jgi:hypothetical protein
LCLPVQARQYYKLSCYPTLAAPMRPFLKPVTQPSSFSTPFLPLLFTVYMPILANRCLCYRGEGRQSQNTVYTGNLSRYKISMEESGKNHLKYIIAKVETCTGFPLSSVFKKFVEIMPVTLNNVLFYKYTVPKALDIFIVNNEM